MENYKVKVSNWDESKEVQKLFITLGANCGIEEITSKWVCLYNGQITFYDLLPNVDFKQITLQYLRDLVVLKRNDVGDAQYIDRSEFKIYIDSNGKVYYFEHRQFNNDQYHTWVESCINGHRPESLKDEYVSSLKPIKKMVDKEVKMKEFLNPEQGYALVKCFVGETQVPESWIEVPEGAEIFLLDKFCGEDILYFVKHDGEVFHEYYISCTDIQNNTWIKGTIKELHKGMGKVLWQRNPTTPNTLIQDKLKIIEKWLNGEKIQYILGIESEKTQTDKSKWHNFTEGAMQYIKRPDIKFREAPKYVTINGIEFKSVGKLLKYVKNNFDLEDGE